MSRNAATRLALLRTAEQLFAERSVDSVSLREIAAAAGQRNHSAVTYHFGDKRELLEALLHRHSGPTDATYLQEIAKLQTEGRESLETLVETLVRPLVAKLDDEDGGIAYLQVCAELVGSRTFPLTSMRSANGAGAQEIAMRFVRYIGEIPPMLFPLRMLRTATVIFTGIVSYQRLCAAGLFIPRQEFIEDLNQSLVALFRVGFRGPDQTSTTVLRAAESPR